MYEGGCFINHLQIGIWLLLICSLISVLFGVLRHCKTGRYKVKLLFHQVYDDDFGMYVDIDDEFVIPDKAKFLIKETVQHP